MKTMLGTGAATNSFDDIERAGLLLLCGVNPTENHPIVGARIKQAVRRGAKLIVVDPRRIELSDYADIHLALRPGGNVALFNAMAACILEEGLVDTEFVARRVAGLEDYRSFIANFSPELMAAQCGLSAGEIRAAARLYAGTHPAMCIHGLGMTEHSQGTEGVMTLINLALLTGNLGKPGSGINPLRGQNNVQGAAQMGCDPVSLTGAQSIAAAGDKFARVWGAPIPASRGLNLLQMMDAAAAGQLKALWAFGYDNYQSLANARQTAQALAKLELLVVQDLFLNETARAFGHVFLPAASVFEREGTFMNSDRRVQRIRAALPPPGEAKPDWWILQQIAQRMGAQEGFAFACAEEIWDEVRSLWPEGAGLSYRRLEQEDLHWPCPALDHPGTPILHGDSFNIGVRANLACIPFLPTSEQVDCEFPLLLITGRRLYHFNAGTMTYRTANSQLQPSDQLDMSPLDAAQRALHEGDLVLVESRYGSARLPLRLSERMKQGELFASFHRADLMVNNLTSPQRDRLVHAREFKVRGVRVCYV
jgi:formate dehydrogenase major subunit